MEAAIHPLEQHKKHEHPSSIRPDSLGQTVFQTNAQAAHLNQKLS